MYGGGMQKKVLTEQASQNEAGTNAWSYVWNETNTTWDLTDEMA